MAAVLAKALADDPTARYTDAAAFASALANLGDLAAARLSLLAHAPLARFTQLTPRTATSIAILGPGLGAAAITAILTAAAPSPVSPSTNLAFAPELQLVVTLGMVGLQLWLAPASKVAEPDEAVPMAATEADYRGYRRRLLRLATELPWLYAVTMIAAIGSLVLLAPFSGGSALSLGDAKTLAPFLGIGFMVAVPWSWAAMAALMVSNLYPRYWTGTCHLTTTAPLELQRLSWQFNRWRRIAEWLPPLAVAVGMILTSGELRMMPEALGAIPVWAAVLLTLLTALAQAKVAHCLQSIGHSFKVFCPGATDQPDRRAE